MKNKKPERQKMGAQQKEEKRKREGGGAPQRRWAQKMIFYMRTVKRNLNEIEAQKKSDFEHPTKINERK